MNDRAVSSPRTWWASALGSAICAPILSLLFSYVGAETGMATVDEGLSAIAHIFIGATGGAALGAAAGAGLLARLGLGGRAGDWIGPAAIVTVAYCVGSGVYLVAANFCPPHSHPLVTHTF